MIQAVLHRRCLDIISAEKEDINRNSVRSCKESNFWIIWEKFYISHIFFVWFYIPVKYTSDFHCHRIVVLFTDRVTKM